MNINIQKNLNIRFLKDALLAKLSGLLMKARVN